MFEVPSDSLSTSTWPSVAGLGVTTLGVCLENMSSVCCLRLISSASHLVFMWCMMRASDSVIAFCMSSATFLSVCAISFRCCSMSSVERVWGGAISSRSGCTASEKIAEAWKVKRTAASKKSYSRSNSNIDIRLIDKFYLPEGVLAVLQRISL